MSQYDPAAPREWQSSHELGDNAFKSAPLHAERHYLKAINEVAGRVSMLKYLDKSLKQLARLYESQNMTGEAESIYLRLLMINQNAPTGSSRAIEEYCRHLGNIYFAQQRGGEAQLMLRKSIALERSNTQVHTRDNRLEEFKLGIVLMWQGQYEEANEMLVQAQQKYSASGDTRCEEYNQILRARADIATALGRAPGGPAYQPISEERVRLLQKLVFQTQRSTK